MFGYICKNKYIYQKIMHVDMLRDVLCFKLNQLRKILKKTASLAEVFLRK